MRFITKVVKRSVPSRRLHARIPARATGRLPYQSNASSFRDFGCSFRAILKPPCDLADKYRAITPAGWKQFAIEYRHGTARYHIRVENPHGVESGVARVWLDGQTQNGHSIPLADDGQSHEVRVEMGS